MNNLLIEGLRAELIETDAKINEITASLEKLRAHRQRIKEILSGEDQPAEPQSYGRKYRRQSEFEHLSTTEAMLLLLEEGPKHADELAGRIFQYEPHEWQRVKTTLVSEAVKLIKQNKLRRMGPNRFGLVEP